MTEKAYKLLAIQEGISNSKAKQMIDSGLVSINKRKVTLAREEVAGTTRFNVKEVAKAKKIFEDSEIFVVDKPAFVDSYEVAKSYPKYILLNRLDKETSGVMLFAKTEEFQAKAIEEFRNKRVYKEYIAIVEGKVIEPLTIDAPISTQKGQSARSKIDKKNGKSATTKVIPFATEGNKSKIKVVIDEGRTHQIRVHLKYVSLPIVGDEIYGVTLPNIHRVLLHSYKTELLGYNFQSNPPRDFNNFGL
jgi:23S rRNA pseudouridine1911/1915/1917 synthase